MNSTRGLSRFLLQWLGMLAIGTLVAGLFALQSCLRGGADPWTTEFLREADCFWAWAIMAPGIFQLCRRLYEGSSSWKWYALGLALGAVAVIYIHLALEISIAFGMSWLNRQLLHLPGPPVFSLSNLGRLSLGSAAGITVYYTTLILAWHAVRHYREKREREMTALKLEAGLRQAELQALRSQLHPHFLFNTLHTIAELVHENPDAAEHLILRLGDLLRQALKSQNTNDVPLARELDFVRDYLEIEQTRLGDRLQVNWDVAPDTLRARVPGLMLQPLVENAIKHGIAPLTRPGRLAIRTARENGHLHVQIRDNGPGLSETHRPGGTGIGLANTKMRLQRLYGTQQQIELLNDHGLVVNVRIPWTTTEMETVPL